MKIINEEPDMEIVAEADGHVQLFKCLEETKPDIILLDISMSGEDGLEIVKELKRSHPRIKILMLSMHPEDRFSVRAIKAGASGYLTKKSAADELVNAIRQVYNEGKFITKTLAERLINSIRADVDKLPHEKLSDREFQILCLIASGRKVKEIAEELFLSPATVATYRARILEKMQLKSNVELTIYVLRHNLIE